MKEGWVLKVALQFAVQGLVAYKPVAYKKWYSVRLKMQNIQNTLSVKTIITLKFEWIWIRYEFMDLGIFVYLGLQIHANRFGFIILLGLNDTNNKIILTWEKYDFSQDSSLSIFFEIALLELFGKNYEKARDRIQYL